MAARTGRRSPWLDVWHDRHAAMQKVHAYLLSSLSVEPGARELFRVHVLFLQHFRGVGLWRINASILFSRETRKKVMILLNNLCSLNLFRKLTTFSLFTLPVQRVSWESPHTLWYSLAFSDRGKNRTVRLNFSPRTAISENSRPRPCLQEFILESIGASD